MKTYQEFYQLVSSYKKSFDKCNVTASRLMDLQNNYTITETYTHKAGRKVIEKKTENVTAEFYANVISGCSFFNDRVSKAYTMAGYIAVRFSAKNPYANETVIREYTFTYNH